MDSEIVLTSILLGAQDKIKSRKILKGTFALEEGQMDIYEIKKIDACICEESDSKCENIYCATGNVKVSLDYISEKDGDKTYNLVYFLPFSFTEALKTDDLEELDLERLSLTVLFPRVLEIEACVTSCNFK